MEEQTSEISVLQAIQASEIAAFSLSGAQGNLDHIVMHFGTHIEHAKQEGPNVCGIVNLVMCGSLHALLSNAKYQPIYCGTKGIFVCDIVPNVNCILRSKTQVSY